LARPSEVSGELKKKRKIGGNEKMGHYRPGRMGGETRSKEAESVVTLAVEK